MPYGVTNHPSCDAAIEISVVNPDSRIPAQFCDSKPQISTNLQRLLLHIDGTAAIARPWRSDLQHRPTDSNDT